MEEIIEISHDKAKKAFELTKTAIEELKHTKFHNTWLEKVFNYMNAGLLITDPLQEDNPIIFANNKFCEITGYGKNEILGKNCRFLQGLDTDKEVVKEIRHHVKYKMPGKFVLLNYRKDGTKFMNELYLAPIYNDQDVLVNFVGIQHDVSD